MLCISAAYAVVPRLPVRSIARPFVTFVYFVETNKYIFNFFHIRIAHHSIFFRTERFFHNRKGLFTHTVRCAGVDYQPTRNLQSYYCSNHLLLLLLCSLLVPFSFRLRHSAHTHSFSWNFRYLQKSTKNWPCSRPVTTPDFSAPSHRGAPDSLAIYIRAGCKFILHYVTLQERILVALWWSTSQRAQYRRHQQLLRRLLDAVPDFRTIPFLSPFIPSTINQCRPDTATDRDTSQSGDDYYTMRSFSLCGKTSDLSTFRAAAGSRVARPGRPRQNVTVVMAYNWTRKISPLRRPIRLRSRISWDAIGNTQLPSSSYLDYKDGKRRRTKGRKKQNEAAEETQHPWDRRSDRRADRRADSGR